MYNINLADFMEEEALITEEELEEDVRPSIFTNRKVLLTTALIITIALLGYVFYANYISQQTPVPSVTHFNVEPQPAGIGFVEITFSLSQPVAEASVFIGNLQAEFVSKNNNTYKYSYYVSPYDDPGSTLQVGILMVDERGNKKMDKSHGFLVDYTANRKLVNGVKFYSYEVDPIDSLNKTVRESENITFIFEADKEGSSRNKKMIDSFVPFITKMSAFNKTVKTTAYEIQDKKRVSCVIENKTYPVGECDKLQDQGTVVLLKQPIYQTMQFYVYDNVVEIQTPESKLDGAMDLLSTLFLTFKNETTVVA